MATDNLSDVTLEINTDEIRNICDNWNQQVASIDIGSINIDSIFSPLTDCGIAVNYITSLKSTIKEMDGLVSSVSSAIKNTADDQQKNDTTISNNTISNNNISVDTGSGSYSSSSSSSSSSGGSYYTPVVNETDNTTTGDEVEITVSDAVYKEFDDLPYKDSVELVSLLSTFITADSSLSTYLVDLNNSEYIKTSLLKRNISDKFKKFIESMDADTVQAAIYYYFTEKSNLSNIAKDGLLNQLLSYDTSSMVSTKEVLVNLIKDSNSTNKSIASLLNDNNIGQSIVSKYKSTNDNLFKSIVNNIAKDINPSSDIEKIFSDSNNDSVIKEKLEKTLKDLNIIKTVGYTNAADGELIISRLLES